MKRIEPPNPTKYDLMPKLMQDAQVKKWTERLKGDPEAVPTDLDEDQLAFVIAEVMRKRGEDFEPGRFKQAMIDSRPVVCAPDWTDEVEDLGHIFRQPELRRFWKNWRGPRRGKGPAINYAGAKAAMTIFAMSGSDKHFDKFRRSLARDHETRAILEEVEDAPVTVPAYSTLLRHIEALGPSCSEEAMKANIECVKALRALYPKKGIGKRLMIDSCDVAAWCRQVGSRDPERDQELRARTPEAGFRRYAYGPNGKTMIEDGETYTFAAGKEVKSWRGYYFCVIADQATGLPLVWMLFDAKHDEAPAIVPLLSLLHRLWPDIEADSIAGDSAWDEHEWNRLCEVDYGIAPIFRLHQSQPDKDDIVLGAKKSRDGSIRAITRTGQLTCSAHMKPLPYYTFDRPNRDGLSPGQSSDERLFRLRAECKHQTPEHPHPCGKVGLKAMTYWLRLTRYPHHMHGDPERHAWRLAMLARLNGVESIFNRLKAGKVLGTKGADRTRLLNRASLEALLSLACLSMSALSLACEREHLGIVLPKPPPGTGAGGSTNVAPLPKQRARTKRPSGAPHVRQRMGRSKQKVQAYTPVAFDFDDVVRVGL
jgi:hypothetical protein